MKFDDHGYFNFIFYFIILGIVTILFPFDLMIQCFKDKKRIIIITIYIFIFFITICIIIIGGANCSDWSKGLNNTYIDNDKTKYGCQIQIPSRCMYKLFGIIQDYIKLGGKNYTLNNNKNLKDLILKYTTSPFINNTVNIIGFPLTNKDPKCFLDNDKGINYLYEY